MIYELITISNDVSKIYFIKIPIYWKFFEIRPLYIYKNLDKIGLIKS